MPRFVILEHDWPHQHWDLMLESGATLRTWRLAESPVPGTDIRAEPIADHRRAYLDYEGPISGNRGSVTRWDSGEFTWQQDDSSEVIVILAGKVCSGKLRISAQAGVARFEPFHQ
ncbi:hypothetical protein BH10PLA2_BH10PLA2_04330 [soil metagenome]